ncbi:MAG: STAS domain-containing protein [Terracidiphilus sp.]
MGTFSWQTWNSGPFSIERKPGTTASTVVLRFCGPFTVRDAYTSMPTLALNKALELDAEGGATVTKHILDMTACPTIDSTGLGVLATHLVRCQKRGVKLVVAGPSSRVREVFKITNMDTVIPLLATVEEAEAR